MQGVKREGRTCISKLKITRGFGANRRLRACLPLFVSLISQSVVSPRRLSYGWFLLKAFSHVESNLRQHHAAAADREHVTRRR